MNPVFTARRRAEEFHSLLEGTSTEGLTGSRDSDLLALVTSLRESPTVQARPAFVDDLRSRLITAATTALAPDTAVQAADRRTPPTRRTARERRVAVVLGGFAVVSATASMAVAAQTALPGEALYPLKRAIEDAYAGVQTDAEGKGTTLLDSASGRLDEVDELSRDSGADDAQISATLHDFSSQASAASELLLSDYGDNGDETSIAELRSFTSSSMTILTELQSLVPSDSRASLIEAARTLGAIDLQAVTVCPGCSGDPVALVPAAARRSIDELLTLVRVPPSTPVEKDRRPVQTPPAPTAPDAPAPETPTGDEPDSEVETPDQPRQPSAPASPDVDPVSPDPIKNLTDGLAGIRDGATDASGGSLGGLLGGLNSSLDALTDPLRP